MPAASSERAKSATTRPTSATRQAIRTLEDSRLSTSPWLVNAAIVGNSTTAWYLFPAAWRPVARSTWRFLDGQQKPDHRGRGPRTSTRSGWPCGHSSTSEFSLSGLSRRCQERRGPDRSCSPRGFSSGARAAGSFRTCSRDGTGAPFPRASVCLSSRRPGDETPWPAFVGGWFDGRPSSRLSAFVLRCPNRRLIWPGVGSFRPTPGVVLCDATGCQQNPIKSPAGRGRQYQVMVMRHGRGEIAAADRPKARSEPAGREPATGKRASPPCRRRDRRGPQTAGFGPRSSRAVWGPPLSPGESMSRKDPTPEPPPPPECPSFPHWRGC